MRSILVAPAWDATLEPLCRALVVAQRHRHRPRPLRFVREIAAAPTAVGDRRRSGTAVLVVAQPGLDAGRAAGPDWMEALRLVRERHPALPIAVVVATPTASGVRRLPAAGATEVIVWEEEATGAGLALRMARTGCPRFTDTFLHPLRDHLEALCELTLFRVLEELRAGGVPKKSDLLRTGGWSPDRIQRGFAAGGIGTFEEWCERTRQYAAISRLVRGGISSEAAATACGFADVAELEAACRRHVGVSVNAAVDKDFIGAIPDAMVRRAVDAPRRAHLARARAEAAEAADEPGACETWPTATDRALMLEGAVRMLGSVDDAEDVVQEAMVRIWRHLERSRSRAGSHAPLAETEHPERGYTLRTVRNVSKELLRKRGRRRTLAASADLKPTGATTAPSDRSAALPDGVERALAALPPNQAVVARLGLAHGWPAADLATLLGVSRSSVRGLRSRALAALRAGLLHPRAKGKMWQDKV